MFGLVRWSRFHRVRESFAGYETGVEWVNNPFFCGQANGSQKQAGEELAAPCSVYLRSEISCEKEAADADREPNFSALAPWSSERIQEGNQGKI